MTKYLVILGICLVTLISCAAAQVEIPRAEKVLAPNDECGLPDDFNQHSVILGYLLMKKLFDTYNYCLENDLIPHDGFQPRFERFSGSCQAIPEDSFIMNKEDLSLMIERISDCKDAIQSSLPLQWHLKCEPKPWDDPCKRYDVNSSKIPVVSPM